MVRNIHTSSRSPSGALCQHVDVAGIDQRISALPGEISGPRVDIREVSRSHSSWEQRADEKIGGLTANEGQNVKLLEIR